MMRFGIPEYRLPRTLIRAEIDKILVARRDARSSARRSRPTFGLAELQRRGLRGRLPLGRRLARAATSQVPGVELDGVVKAVDYLLNVNRGYRMDLGRRVVVIGGGFVAFDAARTALRLGREATPADLEALAAETDARVKEALDSARAALRGGATEVTIVSLESFDEMPVLRTTQGHEEFEETKKEGVALPPAPRPEALPRRAAGSQAVELRGVRLGLRRRTAASRPRYDDDGRRHHRGRRLHPRHRPEAGPRRS